VFATDDEPAIAFCVSSPKLILTRSRGRIPRKSCGLQSHNSAARPPGMQDSLDLVLGIPQNLTTCARSHCCLSGPRRSSEHRSFWIPIAQYLPQHSVRRPWGSSPPSRGRLYRDPLRADNLAAEIGAAEEVVRRAVQIPYEEMGR
jgi:hypothetical protein